MTPAPGSSSLPLHSAVGEILKSIRKHSPAASSIAVAGNAGKWPLSLSLYVCVFFSA
jgi:hypothetical protein